MNEWSEATKLLSGRYRVERELGRGASGAVLLARDVKQGRMVAVKLLDHARGERGLQRFRDEIRNAGRLTHPNILSIFDSGEFDGTLFYVMPWVRGETLKERLAREGRLPIEESVRIAQSVAHGLSYAHAHGIVHRDIKPDNLLLDGAGNVYIADFGVALAVGDPRITTEGVAVGTILYMSPEQASAQGALDGRSDLYALACVLYEMLTGEAPFPGSTAPAVLRSHLLEPPPSVRAQRADVPDSLDSAIRRALAKSPGERPTTAEAFALEIEIPREPGGFLEWLERRFRRGRRPWRRIATMAVTGLIAVALVFSWRPVGESLGLRPALDSRRIALVPLRAAGGLSPPAELEASLLDAFGWWDEVDVADPLEVSDAVERVGDSGLTIAQAAAIAREVGAARFFVGRLGPAGDSLRLDATLYRTASGQPAIGSGSLTFVNSLAPSDSAMRAFADGLLDPMDRADGSAGPAGTRSRAARALFGQAVQATHAWDLTEADSLLRGAVEIDPDFALAQLRLAQVGSWLGEPVLLWRAAADRAWLRVGDLTERDGSLAAGLKHLTAGEYDEACRVYDGLTTEDAAVFAAWYGAGECRRLDPRVVASAASPSGWAFRASYQRAVEAYRRAFVGLPASHQGFQTGRFALVQKLLFTRAGALHPGQLGETRFYGSPVWADDSLALVPFPWAEGEGIQGAPDPAAVESALARQRALFGDIARAWAAAFPDEPNAVHAVALSLEMLGDPAAVDSIQRARALATSDRQRREFAATRVWLLVKHGLPGDLPRLIEARRLADSLLSTADPVLAASAVPLASLASLLGRSALVADLASLGARPTTTPVALPAGIVRTAARLTAYAAAASHPDTLAALESLLWDEVDQSVAPGDRESARMILLERPAFLAFPAFVSRMLEPEQSLQSPLLRAMSAWHGGDHTAASHVLGAWIANQAGLRASTLSPDIVLGEALLLLAMGDSIQALTRLATSLDAIRWTYPGWLRDDPVAPAAVMRQVALRAELAAVRGDDAEARRWADSYIALRADPTRPDSSRLERMRALR